MYAKPNIHFLEFSHKNLFRRNTQRLHLNNLQIRFTGTTFFIFIRKFFTVTYSEGKLSSFFWPVISSLLIALMVSSDILIPLDLWKIKLL